MNITVPDEIAERIGLNEKEMLEFLAVSLYKKKMINGVDGGGIFGISEMEFHGLLEKYDEYVNYDVEDYLEDSKNLKDF